MRKRILYCVLDWGLGHATRSIPIIQSLLRRDCDIVLASDSLALEFLSSEFPSLNSYELPSYDVEYKSDSLILNGIYNFNRIRSAIKAEHALIGHIVKKEKIDATISDNRYGCYAPGIPAIMVTHQLQFRTGNVIQDPIGRMMIKKLLKPFCQIWIPDDERRALSGVLSMSDDNRVRCIGWQSTLTSKRTSLDKRTDRRDNEGEHGHIDKHDSEGKHRHTDRHDDESNNRQGDKGFDDVGCKFSIVAILSGPEPMRTSFALEIRNQFKALVMNCALIRRVKGGDQMKQDANITVYDFLDRNGINRLMNSAAIVLCRSGYSSLMDLQSIGKKAILVPTPGQPEQNYLGDRMRSNSTYVVQAQKDLNVKSAFHQLENIKTPVSDFANSELLDNAITDLFTLEAHP